MFSLSFSSRWVGVFATGQNRGHRVPACVDPHQKMDRIGTRVGANSGSLCCLGAIHERNTNVTSRKSSMFCLVCAAVLAANISPATADPQTLDEKITVYCAAKGKSDQCRVEQTSAAQAQQRRFVKAFQSKELGVIADIARCAKVNTTGDGIDYVAAQECFEEKNRAAEGPH